MKMFDISDVNLTDVIGRFEVHPERLRAPSHTEGSREYKCQENRVLSAKSVLFLES